MAVKVKDGRRSMNRQINVRLFPTICWEEDGVEAAKWRQMAVKVEDGM